MSRKTILLAAAATLIAAVALLPSEASAATVTFRKSDEITIPASGAASTYPSTIGVRNMRGPVTDIQVSLNGVYHTRPRDLDVMLVGPDGTSSTFMSDACGDGDVSNRYWTFHSTGDSVGMPQDACPGADYLPTNFGFPDSFPGSGASGGDRFTDWHRKVLTGQWKLYVVDDEAGESGRIANGWSLTITTGPVDAYVPGSGASGPADPYPLTVPVAAPAGEVVTDVDVDLGFVEHDAPRDLDILLAGPGGQTAVLMSDACGGTPVHELLSFNDESPFGLPSDGVFCRNDVTPADYDPGDTFPAPAPPGPHGTKLSAFDYTDPTGEWRLYAVDDDAAGGDGYFWSRFKLKIETRPRAPVAFDQGVVQADEGTQRALTVTRSAQGDLGPGAVTVTTAPGSASSGPDFAPIRQTIEFAAGVTARTVVLDVPEDALAEPAETFRVTLGDPRGDAALGTPSRADVTIAADAAGPADAVRCGGKEATIVGTPGADRLRGTSRRDVIFAGAGKDRVRAGRGNDLVCGGKGRDRLLGGAGRDRLLGGKGRDRCVGGIGRDRVRCEL